MQATVLGVIDNVLVRDMLAINLQQAGMLVSWVGDAGAASVALRSVLPDLIVVDADCLPASPTDGCNALYASARACGVPVLTLVDPPLAGEVPVNGWVVYKPFGPQFLLDTIAAALSGARPVADEISVRAGGLTLNPLACRISHERREISLRPKEYRLLAFLMKQADRVFERNQLLDCVWGETSYVDERTVDVIVRRLRAALEPYGLNGCIETVRGVGYRFRA